jgi:hypothetical protein
MGIKGEEVGAGIIEGREEVGDVDAEPTLPAHVFTVGSGRGVISQLTVQIRSLRNPQ